MPNFEDYREKLIVLSKQILKKLATEKHYDTIYTKDWLVAYGKLKLEIVKSAKELRKNELTNLCQLLSLIDAAYTNTFEADRITTFREIVKERRKVR